MDALSPTLETYLKAIYNICQTAPYAGLLDITRAMHRSKPTVFRVLNILTDMGIVEKTERRGVSLTPMGQERGDYLVRKHDAVRRFLRDVLGVDADVADAEAGAIAHVISEETYRSLRAYCGGA
jgi:DtxR family Mn-dependent transcriptional regulator